MKSDSRWPCKDYMKPESAIDRGQLLQILEAAGLSTSTSLLAMLGTPFDKAALCQELSVLQDELKLVWDDLLGVVMLSNEEILQMWKGKRETAANAGAWMHSMFESVLNGYNVVPSPMQPELEMMLSFLQQFETSHTVCRTEWAIYAQQENIAGSVDLVLRNFRDGSLIFVDWNRSENLDKKYQSPNYMKAPLDQLMDCQGQAYGIQLSIYKWILETYYDQQVARCIVCCTHPTHHPDPFVQEVQETDVDMAALVAFRRAELDDKSAAVEEDSVVPSRLELRDTQFSEMMSQPEANPGTLVDIHATTKRRRLTEAAQNTAKAFREHFDAATAASVAFMARLPDYHAPEGQRTILQQCAHLLRFVNERRPTWSPPFVRLVAGALTVYRTRYSDMLIRDNVALLWMMEGENHMRARDGVCYL